MAFSDAGSNVYESEEDAAFVAGVNVRTLTNRDDCEYICGIYRLDSGGYVVGTSYRGEHASASVEGVINESDCYNDRKLIAMVHSHPYCNGHIPNEFSKQNSNGEIDGDLGCAFKYKMPIYLAAPNGELKVLYVVGFQYYGQYISINYAEKTVCSGLPADNTLFNCK